MLGKGQHFKRFISNEKWRELYKLLNNSPTIDGYKEIISASYTFDPVTDHVMTTSSDVFDLKKAAAMYFWYKKGDRTDTSIVNYFDEYKRCIDKSHTKFNSNYGYYAYVQNGLSRCIRVLMQDKNTRHACLCINNNDAMGPTSIDKLCTNTIQFFIRNDKLEMVVQMRSSNFLTLLPYDAFMFTVFYQQVYSYLVHSQYTELRTGLIHMQVASLHMFTADKQKYQKHAKSDEVIINDFIDKNWQTILESKLIKALKS